MRCMAPDGTAAENVERVSWQQPKHARVDSGRRKTIGESARKEARSCKVTLPAKVVAKGIADARMIAWETRSAHHPSESPSSPGS